jgi:hypothetical protein
MISEPKEQIPKCPLGDISLESHTPIPTGVRLELSHQQLYRIVRQAYLVLLEFTKEVENVRFLF